MSRTPTLDSTICYSGHNTSTSWEGRHVVDGARFARFAREVVGPRVADAASSFASDLRGMATTGMATEFVERLLQAVPEAEGWEVGEAFAECALQLDSGREVHWPWNTIRDRRTPRACLPGADLVGFYCEGEDVLLLFGEVKTSSDAHTPPNVMSGGSGMTWQLLRSATRLDVQLSLLQWLHTRCREAPYRDLYESAVARYIESQGQELLLVGILLRDTAPSELDLRSRGQVLSEKLLSPTRVELIAWYLPVPIAEWPKLLQEGAT
jgi:hypothetical protein